MSELPVNPLCGLSCQPEDVARNLVSWLRMLDAVDQTDLPDRGDYGLHLALVTAADAAAHLAEMLKAEGGRHE